MKAELPSHLGMHASQIKHEVAVDEHPHVVVALELEGLVVAAISKRYPNLRCEEVVVRLATVV